MANKAGDFLHDAIRDWTGETPNLSCSCARWIAAMNRHGDAWCRKHLGEIVEKLLREAKARATQWRAVPIDKTGSLLNAARNLAWRGAFIVPGSGLLLEPFVRAMVEEALRISEEVG